MACCCVAGAPPATPSSRVAASWSRAPGCVALGAGAIHRPRGGLEGLLEGAAGGAQARDHPLDLGTPTARDSVRRSGRASGRDSAFDAFANQVLPACMLTSYLL